MNSVEGMNKIEKVVFEDSGTVQYTPYDVIGRGWEPLVDQLVRECEANGGQVVQVKEKFGGLRFYYDEPENGYNEFWKCFREWVNAVENLSYYICEYTGKPGNLYTQKSDGSGAWWKTLSKEEARKRNYLV